MADPQNLFLLDENTSGRDRRHRFGGKHTSEATPPHYPAAQPQSDGSQARYDHFQGRWVVYAPQRGFRPNDFRDPPRIAAESLMCPFCSGNESQTPPAVLTVTDPKDAMVDRSTGSRLAQWAVRVVPNKFPAVMSASDAASQGTWKKQAGPWSPRKEDSSDVRGAHEVVIESASHVDSWTQLDLVNVEYVLQAWRERLEFWRDQPGICYVSLFKNVGRDAGASLQHSHSQLIAMDRLPIAVQESLARMEAHQARTGCCMQCDILRHELKSRERLIAHVDDIVAFCPYASSFGMSVRITTSHHAECFEDLTERTLGRIASLVQRVTGWLEKIHPGVAYNYVLNNRPPNWKGDPGAFHWSIDLVPRIGHIAGFEIGSGTMLNSILPEAAAAEYRELAMSENPSTL